MTKLEYTKTGEMFQFLIGRLKTSSLMETDVENLKFQFLIGRLKT